MNEYEYMTYTLPQSLNKKHGGDAWARPGLHDDEITNVFDELEMSGFEFVSGPAMHTDDENLYYTFMFRIKKSVMKKRRADAESIPLGMTSRRW